MPRHRDKTGGQDQGPKLFAADDFGFASVHDSRQCKELAGKILKDFSKLSQNTATAIATDCYHAYADYRGGIQYREYQAAVNQRKDIDNLIKSLRETQARLRHERIPDSLLSVARAIYQPYPGGECLPSIDAAKFLLEPGQPTLDSEMAELWLRLIHLLQVFETACDEIPKLKGGRPTKESRNRFIAALVRIFHEHMSKSYPHKGGDLVFVHSMFKYFRLAAKNLPEEFDKFRRRALVGLLDPPGFTTVSGG